MDDAMRIELARIAMSQPADKCDGGNEYKCGNDHLCLSAGRNGNSMISSPPFVRPHFRQPALRKQNPGLFEASLSGLT